MSSGEFSLKLGAHAAPVKRVGALFDPQGFSELKVYFDVDFKDQVDFVLQFVQDLTQLAGGEPPVFIKGHHVHSQRNTATGQMESSNQDMEYFFWPYKGVSKKMERKRMPSGLWGPWSLEINRVAQAPQLSYQVPMDQAKEPERQPELKADLDSLLDFKSIWTVSVDEFEKKYVARSGTINWTAPPQFEWLSAAKDRARFSRQMFGEAPLKLTLFGGAVELEEAVLEFVGGKLGRVAISIYNRGDAGQMDNAEFQTLFKKAGQSMGGILQVAPRRQISAGSGAVKNVAWMWTSPQAVALLEHNDFQAQGAAGKPEYLRLKLAAPAHADWTMGRMTLGVQRMELQKNVTKDAASGDVSINGVPMVDQGAKGYCVAASCQRLFEYMRIPCDQHEIAQLLEVDADSGTNILVMQKSLAKVDQKFGVTFKPLVNPLQDDELGRNRRVSLKEFSSLIKEHADKGVPLLWALGLGQFPENPPLPNAGQLRGGHMRMIIGYNSAKDQVIFTDSWGAGHEKKRMDVSHAYEATLGLYSMAPRGM
ncbi:C39 family peptidase [Brevifollis gellanilyticus]|nr:C39 family peptidase [Brevifollis gellanilyticus]